MEKVTLTNILVTGTNRGIGLEFVKQLMSPSNHIFATCRNLGQAVELRELQKTAIGDLSILSLDLTNRESIESFSDQIGDKNIDIFINNAGTYGPGFYKPEDARTKFGFKNLKDGLFDIDDWSEVFRVNTIAPLLITRSIADNLKNGVDKKLVFVSSFMGSISDNVDGGHYIYRTSKSALNQLVKGLAIDLIKEELTVIAVHPGWVRTDMGGKIADIDVNTSVTGLLEVINKIGIEDTGKFYNYDGTNLNW